MSAFYYFIFLKILHLSQDVMQGYHWQSTQATLHPFVAYVQSNDDLKVFYMCNMYQQGWHGLNQVVLTMV